MALFDWRIAFLLTLLLFVSSGRSSDEELVPFTFLHTADLHAQLLPDAQGQFGFARLATLIQQEKSDTTNSLILNAGDMVQGTPVSTLFKGTPIFEIADHLGLDVAAIGNHDFDYGWDKISGYTDLVRFPLLTANVVTTSGHSIGDGPYRIVEVNGLRIGIIGAMTEGLPSLVFSEQLNGSKTLPLVETIGRYAKELKSSCDLVVVVAHIGPSEEDALLNEVPEIDLIASGHTHKSLEQPKSINNRLVIRAGSYARELGRLDVLVNRTDKNIASWNWRIIPVTSDIHPNLAVQNRIQHWEEKVSSVVDVQIATSHAVFDRVAVKALIEQAMLEELGTDFAFMNIGGVRNDLPNGPVLARHIWNIMPFDNRVVTGTFKGSQLPSSVVGNRQLDPKKNYTLATIDYVAEKQEREMLAHGLVFPNRGELLRELVIDWIKKKRTLPPAP